MNDWLKSGITHGDEYEAMIQVLGIIGGFHMQVRSPEKYMVLIKACPTRMYNGTLLVASASRGAGMMHDFIRVSGDNLWKKMQHQNVIIMVGHLASPTSDLKCKNTILNASTAYVIYRPNQQLVKFAIFENTNGDRMTLISNKQQITSAL